MTPDKDRRAKADRKKRAAGYERPSRWVPARDIERLDNFCQILCAEYETGQASDYTTVAVSIPADKRDELLLLAEEWRNEAEYRKEERG